MIERSPANRYTGFVKSVRNAIVSRLCLFGLAVAVLAQPAIGGPPYQTDDPEPPITHDWEINIPFTMEKSSDGSLNGEWVTIDAAYAYDDWTQISVILAAPYAHAKEFGTRSSFGDIELQYGRRFGTDAQGGYFGVCPQITLPTGRRAYSLGAGRITADFPVLYQKNITRLSIYTDLRYRLYGGDDGKSYWFWGVAGENDLSERLTIGAEIFATSPTSYGGTYASGFNVGFDISVSRAYAFLISAGRSFSSDPVLTLYAGIQILTKAGED